MYIKSGHSCYMSDLSADERLAVHTDDGIRNLEVNTIVCFALSTFVILIYLLPHNTISIDASFNLQPKLADNSHEMSNDAAFHLGIHCLLMYTECKQLKLNVRQYLNL